MARPDGACTHTACAQQRACIQLSRHYCDGSLALYGMLKMMCSSPTRARQPPADGTEQSQSLFVHFVC